jgi:hypothetical protein
VSAPQTLTEDRISVEQRLFPFVRGIKGQDCPRKGYSVLRRKFQNPLLIETRCKQKRCVPCGPAVRAHVALKAEIGSWIRGGSYFITTTYKMGIGLQKDAGSVQADWRRFLYLLKRNYPQLTEKMHWMKVIELTQQGQPHLHLIVTGLPGGTLDRCRGRKNEKRWVELGCFQAVGTCLLHAVSKTWMDTTGGTSWVCDASKVRSASQVGNYVGKYITKAYEETGLAKLGFKRVWSASQGFAPDLRVRLAGTVAGKWTKVEHFFSKYDQGDWVDRSRDDPDLKLVGHPLVMEKIEKRERQRKLKLVEDLARGFSNNKQTIDSKYGAREQRPGGRVPTYAAR